jgi:hypothetical protein
MMPWTCHPSMAVTGAQCIAACVLTPGTVAAGLGQGLSGRSPELVTIEHPSGEIEVTVSFDKGPDGMVLKAAGLLRTARLIARGEVMVPKTAWQQREPVRAEAPKFRSCLMPPLEPLAAGRDAIQAERRRVVREISAYPGPIAGCDEQFNHLLDIRARLERALAELDRPEPIPTTRRPL